MKDKRGFSLIELLAVVIIMGILLLIGVISVTRYISESRKDGYITNAKVYINAARNMYGSGKLTQMPRDGEAILIPLEIIDTDKVNKGFKTPYGEFVLERSYVVIVNEEDERSYYIVTLDTEGYGIRGVLEDHLQRDSVSEEQKETDYPTIDEVRQGKKIVDLETVEYKVSPRNVASADTVLLSSGKLKPIVEINKTDPETGAVTPLATNEWASTITVKLTSNVRNGITQKFQWYHDGAWEDFCTNVKNRSCEKTLTGNYEKDVKFRVANITGEVLSPDSDTYKLRLDNINPTCELKLDGIIGEDNWYTSDIVTVSFKETKDNLSGAAEWGIGNYTTKSQNVTGNHKSITVTGQVKDRAGNFNTCSITFKKNSNKIVLTLVPNGGSYNIAADTSTYATNVTLNIGNVWENDLKTAQYKLTKDNVTEPTSGWTDFTNGQTITISLTGGNNYLWTKVVNNAGTRADQKVSNNYMARYTIAYDANGGSGAPGVQYKTHNESLTLSSTEPKRDGWTFLGWSKTKNGTTVDYVKGAVYNENQARTLYAVWRRTVTVTFMPNNSNTEKTTRSCYVYNNQTDCVITSPTITPGSGFSVLGWNTSASATASTWTQNTEKRFGSDGTWYAITRSTNPVVVTFDKNGASNIGSTSQSCYRYNGSSNCTIKSPTITAPSGFAVVGWHTNKASTTSEWAPNTDKTFSGNATYYAITKSTAQITVTFNVNGASKISKTSESCYRYNGASGCSITSPTITAASGFNVLGWNTDRNAIDSSWAQNTAKTFTTNAAYYAITKSNVQITITFNANGASKVSATSLSCYRYNGSSTCNITSPTITAASGFTVVGWHTNKSSTTSDWAQNTARAVSANATWYAITRSSAQITITFDRNGAGNIGSTSQSCYRYNGASSCNVTSPTITAASGFVVIGWNTGNGAYDTAGWAQNTSRAVSANAKWYATTKSSAQITITFDKNGAANISKTSASCYRYNGASTCNVTSATITAASGFSVLGWNTNKNATDSTWNQNIAKGFSANTTYYAITKSNAQITITFDKNGASNIGATSLSCYRYNGSSTCNIQAPTITAATGFTAVGWNTNKGATDSTWGVGSTKAFSGNGTWYAITKASSQITVTFNVNGASSVGATSRSCYRYNGSSTCNIQAPTITAASGFSALGWNTNKDATSSIWNQNDTKAFSANTTYYAITRSNAQITVTFDKNGASNIGATSLSCYRYNGASTCNIKAPTITATSGFTALGWNTNKSATSSVWDQNATKAFNGNITYYAITRSSAQITITFNANGASKISKTSESCYRYNGAGTCNVTSPTITAANGFTVIGWNTNKSATTSDWAQNTARAVSANATWYAITKSTGVVTVTFIQNGAAGISAKSATCYKYNGSGSCNVTSPTITAASGFTVLGWNELSGATASSWAQNTAKSFSANATYFAITRSSAQITITFNANGSSKVSATSLSCYRYNGAGTCKITSPTITPASGFSVVGFNTTAGATTSGWAQNLAREVNANATWYAITRSSAQITITFNKNGAAGISATSASCYRYNGAGTCNVTSPTITAASGFSVIGWNTGNGASNTAGWAQNTARAVSANATWYATTRGQFTATFNKNTAASISSGSVSCYRYNGAASCGITAPTIAAPTYFYVVGWNTNSAATTAQVGSGAGVTLTGNVTYYAIVARNYITITFQPNGGSGSAYTQSCPQGAACALTGNRFSRTYFTYKGWSTSNSGGVTHSNGGTYTFTGNITLYAVWQQNVITITYQPNGGSGSAFTNLCPQGSPCGILDTRFSRANYSFLGWSTSSGGGVTHSVGGYYTFTGDTTLYAVWKLNAVTITFQPNGGSGAAYTQSCTVGASCTLTGNRFSRTNYVFGGWATSSGADRSYVNGQAATFYSDTTLYAKWGESSITYYPHASNWAHVYTVPVSGTYFLRVYGAEGGGCTNCNGGVVQDGGNGGVSYGYAYLTAGTTLYIVVGRAGSGATGGFNGGGNGVTSPSGGYYSGGGGGATHIGTRNTTLAGYGNTSGLLIVAGGGGGVANSCTDCSIGGAGGGAEGQSIDIAHGGSQTGPGTNDSGVGWGVPNGNGSFGQGGHGFYYNSNYHTNCGAGEVYYSGGGGGGGLYGGAGNGISRNGQIWGSGSYWQSCGGAGGSGWIGGVSSGGMETGTWGDNACTGTNGAAQIFYQG